MAASSLIPSIYNTIEGLITKKQGSGRRRRTMKPMTAAGSSKAMHARMAKLRAMRGRGGAILTPGPLL